MSTFFSGTDTDTLKSEGADTPHFVSLIVNNNGPYCAKITRRVTEKVIGTIEAEYPTFDDGKITSSDECKQAAHTYLEAFKLEIDIEGNVDDALRNEVEARYKELTTAKKAATPTYGHSWNSYGGYGGSYNGATPTPSFQAKGKEIEKEEEKTPLVHNGGYVDSNGVPHLSDNAVKALVGQILYGSITMSVEGYEKLNKREWITTNMKKSFEKRFGGDSAGLKKYEDWATSYIDTILNTVEDSALKALGYTPYELSSVAAADITEAILDLTDSRDNKFVNSILDILEDYIIEDVEDDLPTSKTTTQPNLFNQNLEYYDND